MTTVELPQDYTNEHDYHVLESALVRVDSLVSASELHGMLCGLICAGATEQGEAWLDTVILAMEPRSEEFKHFNRDILQSIFKRSYEQITGFGFDFQLILPDEDASISARAQAIGEWCQGFLEGLGFAGSMLEPENLSEDVTDALQRLYDITYIEFNALSPSEDDETAMLELTEFVRMAVLMVYTELVMKVQEDLYGDQSGVIH